MRQTFIILTVFCLLITNTVQSQSFKLGQVTADELSSTSDPIFPEVGAVVLSRRVENFIGNYIDVYERIKIYTKEGYDKATVYIPYVKVEKVKAATYNLVDGVVEKTTLDKDLIFEDEVIKGYEFKKFTFPKVAIGSIIEFSYRATRGTTSDISMQYDIPIRKLNIMVRNNTSTVFDILQNPRAFINVNRQDLDFKTIIAVDNVPPLIEENYVSDINRYRAKLTISSKGSKYSFKTNNFGDFGQLLMNSDDFTRGFKVKKSFEPLVKEIIGDTKGERAKDELIYNYVHNDIEWDEYYGIFPDNSSSRETLKKKKGDLADINMLYIALLRAANIGAHPTLASTRNNGLPITASYKTFNYLLVCANIEGQRYLVDAAHTEAAFDRLPKTVINYKALILKDDGKVDWEIIQEPKMSDEQIMVNLSLDEDLLVEGRAKERYTGYYAYNYADFLEDLGDKRKEDVANYKMEGFEANDIEIIQDTIRNNVNISYNFEIEEAVEEIGNKLYFAPLFFLAMDDNPFLSEKRAFPIFFNYPNRQRFTVTMKLPEGYSLEYMPEPVSLQLPDGVGVFTYNITHNKTTNSLQLQTNTQINKSEVDAGSYLGIKEFYKRMLEKETEKIVLVKL